jgi:RNA polymerase sigma factor (sigma-70 family)
MTYRSHPPVNTPIGNRSADKHLVDSVLRGNTQAFGAIIKSTEAMIAQIVYKMIPNPEDRKDIAQDVYLRAFHKLDSFKFQSKLSTWIAQIAYNACLSWLEKKKLVFPGDQHEEAGTHEEALESVHHLSQGAVHNEAEKHLSQKELSSILRVEVDNLPTVYRTLITLFHHENLTYDEMVQITGLNEGTLKSYLFRARKQLKENLLSKYKKEAL